MRIRILKDIPTPRLEGFDVSDLRRGMVYETGRSLCEILFAYGYAAPEEGIAETVPPLAKDQANERRRRRNAR